MAVAIGGQRYALFPWTGTVGFRTLERCLRGPLKDRLGIRGVDGFSPCFFLISATASPEDFTPAIRDAVDRGLTEEDLLDETEVPRLEKFDEFVPPHLLRKAFASDCLDLSELAL